MKHLVNRVAWISIFCFAAAAPQLSAQTERWGYLHEMFPQVVDYPAGCAIGDVDGDSDLDLYVTMISQGYPAPITQQDRLYLNDGRGRFTDATSRLPVDNDEAYGVALGDIDNDGDLDAAIANRNAPCRFYLNDGLGNFQDAPTLVPSHLVGPIYDCVALEDFDLDGDLDVFFAGDANMLWLNFGGVFLDATGWLLPPPSSSPTWTRDVSVGDIDGDGDPDLVLGNFSVQGGLASQIFLNFGSASFADVTATHLASSRRSTTAVDLGDVDGDGDLDLYVANFRNGGSPIANAQDQLFLNSGSGQFTEVTFQLPAETYSANDAAFVDLDRDGDLDVLVANGFPRSVPSEPDLALLNNGAGLFSPSATGFTTAAVNWSTHRFAIEDFDSDGDMDCVSLSYLETRMFMGRGNGELLDVTNPNPWLVSSKPATGDFDGDGVPDLAAIATLSSPPASRRCLLLRGRGDGTFEEISTQMPDVPEAYHVATGDFDRDGDLDLVFSATTSALGPGELYFMINDGTGRFSNAWTITLTGPAGRLAVGDVDRDGLLDIVASSSCPITPSGASSALIIINLGPIGFAELAGVDPLDPGTTVDLSLGDLNGDGYLDLFLARFAYGTGSGIENRVYLNTGSGLFVAANNALPPHFEPSNAVSLGDVDGDGDLDALVGNLQYSSLTQLPLANRLYLNNGGAVFTDASALLPTLPADTTYDVELFDSDADGDLDAYISNSPDASRLYRNNGAGLFLDASSELPAGRGAAGYSAIADFDRDGDPDICTASFRRLMLFNLQRQLAVRTPQSLGKSFAMDLYGDAGAPWVLLASPGTAAIGIPPIGTLYLDPANLAIVVAGSFDAQGRASFDFRVPRWNGLLDQLVYWQAVMNSVPQLSNFETTVVTDF